MSETQLLQYDWNSGDSLDTQFKLRKDWTKDNHQETFDIPALA